MRLLHLKPRLKVLRCIYLVLILCGLCYLLIGESRDHVVPTKERKISPEFNPMKLEPSIDRSNLSNAEMAEWIQRREHNLPITFWEKVKGMHLSMNESCAAMPSLYEIHFNNEYWQSMDTTNGSYYLYAAYYDNRTLEAKRPVIRLLGMVDRLQPTVKPFCQIWFDGNREPVFSQVYQYKWIWYKEWDNYGNGVLQPYLMTCKIPSPYKDLVPESVSLAERPCDNATIHLRIINNRPPSGKKEDFAVCVKSINYPFNDFSVRLVEWFELLFLLGANKVFVYDMAVHSNVSKVLNHYKAQGRVDITKMTLPGHQPNAIGVSFMYVKAKITHKRQNEVIPYNDCFYKSMYKYKYITLLDIDEVIMPRSSSSWQELLSIVKRKDRKANGHYSNIRSSYVARHVYFLDDMRRPQEPEVTDVPNYMYMLQNIYHSGSYTQPLEFIKCFHNTERILTLHNHFPVSCLGPWCSLYFMNTDDVHLQHYREDCVEELKEVCGPRYRSHPTKDTSILRYKKTLVENVAETLRRLNFFKSEADNELITR